MRQLCLKMVHELARADERVVFIGSDLGAGTLAAFREEFPDRFFMEGVSEANVLGMAAGLAMEGHIVYVNTLAVFITRRAFEQASLDIAMHNLNVRLIGNGGGLVYAPLGPTHMAIEDLALMRAIPNMTIVAPADACEMGRLMPQIHEIKGPVYIRLAKGNDPVVTSELEPPAIGKALVARQGSDVLLATTGITLAIALQAADVLAHDGLDAKVLHFHTVKPLDVETLVREASSAKIVVSIEEHVMSGGLGSAVAEVIAEARWNAPKTFRRVALPDAFPSLYGSQAGQLQEAGVTAERIVELVRDRKSGV